MPSSSDRHPIIPPDPTVAIMPALNTDDPTVVRFSLPTAMDKRNSREGDSEQTPPRSLSETCVRDSTSPSTRLVGASWRKKTELGWFVDEIRRLARAEESRRGFGVGGGRSVDERRTKPRRRRRNSFLKKFCKLLLKPYSICKLLFNPHL